MMSDSASRIAELLESYRQRAEPVTDAVTEAPVEVKEHAPGDCTIIEGDMFDILSRPEEHGLDQFDVCITSPPMFTRYAEKMVEVVYGRDAMNNDELNRLEHGNGYTTKNFLSYNIRDYMLYTAVWAEKVRDVLKPGGLLAVVAAQQTWPGVLVGLDFVNFEIRTTVAWTHLPLTLSKSPVSWKPKIVTLPRGEWSPVVIAQAPYPKQEDKPIPMTRKAVWEEWGTGGITAGLTNVISTPDDGPQQGVDQRKPKALIAELMNMMCPIPEMKILDPFGKYGSVGVCAIEKGHHAYLIEKSPERIARAMERIALAEIGEEDDWSGYRDLRLISKRSRNETPHEEHTSQQDPE